MIRLAVPSLVSTFRRFTTAPAQLALLAALLGGACVPPAPVVRLTPMHPPSGWAAGAAVVTAERHGIRVATAFSGQREQMVGLRVEIFNGTAEALTFDPSGATYLACSEPPRRDARGCGPRTRIHDPEQLLLDLDLAQSTARAAKENEEATGAAFALLGVVGGVAAAAGGDADLASDSFDDAVDSAHRHDVAADAHERRAQHYAAARGSLETVMMRKSTIAPGQAAAGIIYLPLHEDARVIQLSIPVQSSRFHFDFAQTVYYAGGGNGARAGRAQSPHY